MRLVVRGLVLTLLVVAIGAYLGDWAIYKMRGSPRSHIRVSHFVSAPLKDDKQEIDYIGSEDMLCSVTMFPQQGYPPCWYLSRHRNQVTRY
ncbi:MAG: hypothetical protein ACLGSD_01575 [Acidobacteriota bacterium]